VSTLKGAIPKIAGILLSEVALLYRKHAILRALGHDRLNGRRGDLFGSFQD
jgi:hypothetical protein